MSPSCGTKIEICVVLVREIEFLVLHRLGPFHLVFKFGAFFRLCCVPVPLKAHVSFRNADSAFIPSSVPRIVQLNSESL